MRIKQISVTGLFGIFDHVIPLNINQRITIIHGLNGFGKTNILRMLSGLINSDYSIFYEIPFNSFQINFSNGSSLELVKTKQQEEKIAINFSSQDSSIVSFDLSISIDLDSKLQIRKKRRRLSKSDEKRRVSLNKLSKSRLTVAEILAINNINLLEKTREPKWLKNIQKSINVRLIESQRLLYETEDDSSSMLPTVSSYSDEIAKLMQDKFAEYGKISQSLDRTFPIRAIELQQSVDFTVGQLRQQFYELENKRSRLTQIGLLDTEEKLDFPSQPENIEDSSRHILSVYVEDANKKLSVFDDIANKIELLRKIINCKFAYSYKQIDFSKEKGFVITTCYPETIQLESKVISPTDLSSGEQHELVLLYELLFKVDPGTLVLIDEPELSLHVGWQLQFLEDLQEITELADLDILMATHSPDIIQDNWEDLTVELKAPGK